jgi:hypothetical protein
VLALPAPHALVVALAALVASGRTGLAGASGPGVRAIVAGICGALVAWAVGLLVVTLPPLGASALVYASLLSMTIVVEALAGARRFRGGAVAYELANVAAAAVLLDALRDSDLQGSWAPWRCSSSPPSGARRWPRRGTR